MKVKPIILQETVFGSTVHVLLGHCPEEVAEYGAKVAPTWACDAGDDPDADAEYWQLGPDHGAPKKTFIVSVPDWSKHPTPNQISLLVHELFHVTAGVMDYVGVTLDGASEEAFAYFLGNLVCRVLEK